MKNEFHEVQMEILEMADDKNITTNGSFKEKTILQFFLKHELLICSIN